MQIKVIKSRRKSFGLEIKNAEVIVRAPIWATSAEIEAFVKKHSTWIEKKLAKAEARQSIAAQLPPLGDEDIKALAKSAKKVIPERVAYYAPIVGVSYGSISIRTQRTRWGSCSSKGNLSFNCLLMLAPPEVLDGVVVHELCHIKQMNHSKAFYAEVLRVYPDYKQCAKWLKENGAVLMARIKSE